jgi:DNA polymerase-3 subunit delta
MRLRPEQLPAHLEKSLQPVYVVSGDEPLLVQECCDQIRAAARSAGCAERELLDAGATGFRWPDLVASASSMSLFADRRLLELRLPSGKPGVEGGKALGEYLELAGEDDVLLFVTGRIDRQATSSKWFKALDSRGVIIQVWPVDARSLPRWLRQRVAGAGMSIDDDALQLLCERVEGNLLAAVQEVAKLALLAADGHISVQTVIASVAENARYNPFELADSALRGDVRASLRMLHGLRAEGTDAAAVLWALGKEIRSLHQLRADCDRGQNPQQAMAARRVWKSRVPLVQAALSRHDRDSVSRLLQQAIAVDGSIKGYAPGTPWDHLETLITAMC